MTEFRPCIAVTKAKINGAAIRDGQLIVVVETGELFFDYNGRRIALVQGNGDSPDSGEESDPLLCRIVNPDTRISSSIQGGGGSFSGSDGDDETVFYHPQPVTPEFGNGFPAWPVFLSCTNADAAAGGGGPHSGLTAGFRPLPAVPEFDGSSLIFSVFHGNR